MRLAELLARRSDLSTFIVHLTKENAEENKSAEENLISIINAWQIEAKNVMGQAKIRLKETSLESQRCVSFTETPLEYIYLLCQKIDDLSRECKMEPYGIAMTKMAARGCGVNPVWYVDMTPGHDWLVKNLNAILDKAINEEKFIDGDVEKIMPFIEQMGTWPSGKKEFWWEREWRYVGNFCLPDSVLGICPENKIKYFEELSSNKRSKKIKFISPSWSMEEIISYLSNLHDKC